MSTYRFNNSRKFHVSVIYQKFFNDRIVFQPIRLYDGKKSVCQSRVYINLDYISMY